MSLYTSLQHLSGARFSEANHAGDVIDYDLLRVARTEGIALPSAGQTQRDKYHGAAVFTPKAGIHRNVCYPDYSCFTSDHEVMTPEGPKKITEFEVGDEVYTLDEETHDLVVDTVVDTHEYQHSGKIHDIQSESMDVAITSNHNLYTASQYRGPREELDTKHFTKQPVAETARSFRYLPDHDGYDAVVDDEMDISRHLRDSYVVLYVENGRAARWEMPDAVHECAERKNGVEEVGGEQRKWCKYYVPISAYRSHKDTLDKIAKHVRYKRSFQCEPTTTKYDTENLLRFIGWFVTEGSASDSNPYHVKIANEDPSVLDELESLAADMGMNPYRNSCSVTVSNGVLREYLVRTCGGSSHQKKLPAWALQLPESYASMLLDVLIEGDGRWGENGAIYYTSSDQLAEDVAQLAVLAGWKPRIKERHRESTEYEIYIRAGGSVQRETQETVREYDGSVHCITCENNHVVLAGRNGHFQWIGQSLYPNFMRDVNASPETIIGVGDDALDESQWQKDDVRWSYIDPRPVKHLDPSESYGNFMDGTYKMVYDPKKSKIRWRDDWSRIQQHLEPVYFVPPSYHEGILPSRADTYIRWNKSYTGTMYSATKRQRNCFTPDTEVVTPDGLRNIRDLEVGDEVYSLDPETLEMEVKPVTAVHVYPDYEGDLVEFENSYVDFGVTPNHRMLVRKENTSKTWDEYRFVEAGELDEGSHYTLPSDWSFDGGDRFHELDLSQWVDDYEVLVDPTVHGHTFADELGWYPERRTESKRHGVTSGYIFDAADFEANRKTIDELADDIYIHHGAGHGWVPLMYDGDDAIELLCWFVTEGNSDITERREYETTVRGEAKRIGIAQEYGQHREEIRTLFERMGLPYSETERKFTVGNALWYDLLVDWCGEDSHTKQLPGWLFECSREQLELAFETLVAGDGDAASDTDAASRAATSKKSQKDSRNDSYRYTTSSKQLRDDVMCLVALLGRNPRYTYDNGSWRVWFSETENTMRPRRCASTSTTDDGVYCVTVEDNHTLLAGRNGTFQWVGQSLYGVSGDSNFRLFDWRVAEAITIGGRLLLEYGADVIIQRLQSAFDDNIVYRTHGDTDGFGVAVDQDVSRGHVLPRVRDAVDWLNDTGMPQFVEDEFNVPADETAHAVDLESYSPKLFIPAENGNVDDEQGTKKTYAERVTWEEGEKEDELDITGFECVRSDVAEISESVQHDVLEAIIYSPRLEAQNIVYERIREAVGRIENILDARRESRDRIESSDVGLEEIGQRSGIGKDPEEYGSENRSAHPEFRGAKYAKRHIPGEQPSAGSNVMKYPVARIDDEDLPRVYQSETAEGGTLVDYIAVEDPSNIPEGIVLDRDVIVEKTLRQPLRDILGTLGWEWDSAVYDHEQSGLEEFEA